MMGIAKFRTGKSPDGRFSTNDTSSSTNRFKEENQDIELVHTYHSSLSPAVNDHHFQDSSLTDAEGYLAPNIISRTSNEDDHHSYNYPDTLVIGERKPRGPDVNKSPQPDNEYLESYESPHNVDDSKTNQMPVYQNITNRL